MWVEPGVSVDNRGRAWPCLQAGLAVTAVPPRFTTALLPFHGEGRVLILSRFTDGETETQESAEPKAVPHSRQRNPKVKDVFYNRFCFETKKHKPVWGCILCRFPSVPFIPSPSRGWLWDSPKTLGWRAGESVMGPDPGGQALTSHFSFLLSGRGHSQASSPGLGSEFQDHRDWELGDLRSHHA